LYITIDGSAVSPISKFKGKLKEVDYLRNTTSSLAFEFGPNRNALIIGVGGGQEVLTAQMAGFKDIEAVDINKGSFDAVHALADASGDIFQQEGVEAIVSDGRNYIRSTENTYDLIYLSLVMKQSEHGLGLALTENFIYTQEAIKEYMDKLNDNGRLAFLLHNDTELNKIMHAAKTYYREQGISEEDEKNYMAVVGTYQHLGHVVAGMGGSQITRPLIILQKQPFEQETAASLFNAAQRIQQIPVHIPHVYDQFQNLKKLFDTQDVNVEANRDNMPFFYNTTETLPATLYFGLFLTLLTALFILSRKVLLSGQAVYFSGIAIGFMLIEVTFIQKLILPLGHPTLSFVIVLGVLLVAGGLGSYFSNRWRLFQNRYLPLFMVGCLAILANAMIGWYYNNPLDWSQTYRVLTVIGLLFPLGFFMGMPFPFGLSRLKREQIAMSWGFNGVMTVAGSLLAAMISLTFGFAITIWVGAALYVVLFTLQPLLKFK
jgi:spermidine synthase